MAAKKKMSMKQAMDKYEKSPADMKADRAGAKKLMKQGGKGKK
jgi:hypothetical protein